MVRTASRLLRASLIAGVAAALTVVGAAPALAAAPDGTAVLTDVYLSSPNSEVGNLVVTGSCDAASYAAEVHYENLTTGELGYYFQNLDAEKNFTFDEDPLSNMGDPGDELSISIVCVLLDNTPTATSEGQKVTLIDLGTTISVADVTVGQPITINGSCGTAESVTHVNYVVYDVDNETLIAEGTYATSGGEFSITGIPSTLGMPGEGYAGFQCVSEGEGTQVITEWRDTNFALLAVPAPVPAAVPVLPNTGFAAVPVLALGGALAIGGILLIAFRRRARA